MVPGFFEGMDRQGCGPPDPNVGPGKMGNPPPKKTCSGGGLMGKLSPRIPRKDNNYHGYTVTPNGPLILNWMSRRFFLAGKAFHSIRRKYWLVQNWIL